MTESTTSNPVSATLTTQKPRRREPWSHPENALRQMAKPPFYFMNTAWDRGHLVTVGDQRLLYEAALAEMIKEEVNGGRLAMPLPLRVVMGELPAAAVTRQWRERRIILPPAAKFMAGLAEMNSDRVTYWQWNPDVPSAVQGLLFGFYAGQPRVEMLIDGDPITLAITTKGYMMFTGKIVNSVRQARAGKIYEAQSMLDAIAKDSNAGLAFDFTAFVKAQRL